MLHNSDFCDTFCDAAFKAASAALEVGRQGDLKAQQQAALQMIASIQIAEGKFEVGLERALEAFALPVTKYSEGVLLTTLASIQLQRGALGEGLQYAGQSIANADELSAPPLCVSRRAMFAQIILQCGDTEGARVVCEEALSLAAPLELEAQTMRARLTLGLIAFGRGDVETARAQLEAFSISELESELERRIAWARVCTASGDAAAVRGAELDLSLVSPIQGWRWNIEIVRAKLSLEPDNLELRTTLDGIAEALATTGLTSFDALEARSALLELRPEHTPLRAWHDAELTRLEANLPLQLRAAFRIRWAVAQTPSRASSSSAG